MVKVIIVRGTSACREPFFLLVISLNRNSDVRTLSTDTLDVISQAVVSADFGRYEILFAYIPLFMYLCSLNSVKKVTRHVPI